VGSAISRECDGGTLLTRAGPEIGVASTKAYTTQLAALFLVAVKLGRLRGALSADAARGHLETLRLVPGWMEQMVRQEAAVMPVAKRCASARDVLFLGRGSQYPVALEGALKLKEISYIHAEGYAAGEMKHGPIAMIDETMPVVVLAPRSPLYEKTVSNLTEVRAREGKIIAIATRGDSEIGASADEVILVPDTALELQPILTVLPLQLLAYYVADFKGTDIDQPRNLAKSVTVE
jgi:glucosamine--fructose-6-phosphate aminotransferase (isomerizing)